MCTNKYICRYIYRNHIKQFYFISTSRYSLAHVHLFSSSVPRGDGGPDAFVFAAARDGAVAAAGRSHLGAAVNGHVQRNGVAQAVLRQISCRNY